MGSFNKISFHRLYICLLLHHLDPERYAAQEFIPLVVVAQVAALYPALHGQLLVVVLLGEQQLHSHQGLHVVLLHQDRGDHLLVTHHLSGRLVDTVRL